MKKTNNKHYEAPKAEAIAMETQGVLCASGSGAAAGHTGNGFQFGTQNGTW